MCSRGKPKIDPLRASLLGYTMMIEPKAKERRKLLVKSYSSEEGQFNVVLILNEGDELVEERYYRLGIRDGRIEAASPLHELPVGAKRLLMEDLEKMRSMEG